MHYETITKLLNIPKVIVVNVLDTNDGSVAWRGDGQQLVSIGSNDMACIWDATNGTLLYQLMIAGDAEVLLNGRDEVIQANDAAWPYLVRMGNNPETGEQMLIPAEVDEIGVVNSDNENR
jgi:hypothetical protein